MEYLDHIVQADDVTMIDLLKNNNLGLEALLEFRVEASGSYLLDCHFGALNTVAGMPHRGKRAHPYLLGDHIVPHREPPTTASAAHH